MPPTAHDDWLAAARARAFDAQSLADTAPQSVGAVYLAGYAIECSLKAYLQRRGLPFPTSGSQGHHLRGLWKQCGWPLSMLQDRDGAQTFFLEHWTTDLRYEERLPADCPADGPALVRAAAFLSGWVQTQAKRARGRG